MSEISERISQEKRRPTTAEIIIQLTRRGPIHFVLIGVALLWLVPTVGLGITSFRSRGDIAQSGWWTTITGNRSASVQNLEFAVGPDAGEAELAASTEDSRLLGETSDGFPDPAVSEIRIVEIIGQLRIDNLDEPYEIPEVGTLTLDAEEEEAAFEAADGFDGFFVLDEVEFDEASVTIDYRLAGRAITEGQIEVEELNDGVRVPATGTLTVLPDGSYTFERRSSFFGSFEAVIEPEALEERPIIVTYFVDGAGGIYRTAEAGSRIDLPLAGTLEVGADGGYEFSPDPDFSGEVITEVDALNAIFTLDNYRGVLEREDLPPPGFVDNLRNSFIITIPSTILPILLAALAAYAFAWMDFPFRDYIYLLVIALLVVPLQTTWVPVLKVLNFLGINGSFPGIWITHTAYGMPFAIFLLYNFFRDLPREVFESARIDGANEGVVFFRIVLPLSIPAIASLLIFQFVWVWNDLMNALIFLDRDKAPLTIGIRNLLGQYGNEWHLLAAGAFITMIIPLIVFLGFQRYFVRGLTAGAVKG